MQMKDFQLFIPISKEFLHISEDLLLKDVAALSPGHETKVAQCTKDFAL